jgi:hypothetical protein
VALSSAGLGVGAIAVHVAHLFANNHTSTAYTVLAAVIAIGTVGLLVWAVLDLDGEERERRERAHRQQLADHADRALEKAVERIESNAERVGRFFAASQPLSGQRVVKQTTYFPDYGLHPMEAKLHQRLTESTGEITQAIKPGSL